jgi:probable addiction module antidote protein
MPKRTQSYHGWLLKKLSDPSYAKRYLKQAIADSPAMFLKALRNVAEAKGMSKVAEEAGVNRESLYRTLSEEGNPEYRTFNSLLVALGVKLTVEDTAPTNTLRPGTYMLTAGGANFIVTGATATTNVSAQVSTKKRQDYILVPIGNRDGNSQLALVA